MAYKPVGADENGQLPPRVVTKLKDTIAGEVTTPGTATATALSAAYAKLEVVQLSDYLNPSRVEGTTNDAPALTAALAALPAGGGRLVWARANLRITTPVDFNKPVTILGAHRSKSKITVTDTKLISISASDVTFSDIAFHGSALQAGWILFNSEKTVAANHKNWRFENCLFDDCGTVRFSKIGSIQTDGTLLTKGTDISEGLALVRCEARGIRSAYGIEINGIDGVTVENCDIHHNGIDTTSGEGLKVMGSANNVRIALNNIHHNARDGIDMYDCLGGIVTGNDLHNNGIYGIEAKWATITAHVVDKFIVSNNRVHTNAGGGLNVDVPLSLIVNNQVYNNTGTGIRVGAAFDSATTPTKYSTINANVISANTGNGIVISNVGDSLTVTANQSHNNGLSGIALSAGTTGILVGENQCFGNVVRGINVEGTGHTILPNRTQDPGGYYLYPGSSGHITTQAAGSAQTGIFTSGYYYGPGGGRTTGAVAAGTITFAPFWVGTPASFTRIGTEVTTAGAAGSLLRLGIYRDAGNGLPGNLVLDAGTIDAATTGAKELTIAQTLAPGLYWLTVLSEVGSPSVRTVSGVGLTPVGAGSLATATGTQGQAGHYNTGLAAGSLPAVTAPLSGRTTPGPAVVVLRAG